MNKDDLTAIAFRVPRSTRNAFIEKAKSEEKKPNTLLKDFVYDYLGLKQKQGYSISNSPKVSTFSFSDELYNKLDAICKQEGISRSSLLRELMRRYIQDNE